MRSKGAQALLKFPKFPKFLMLYPMARNPQSHSICCKSFKITKNHPKTPLPFIAQIIQFIPQKQPLIKLLK